MSDTPQPDREAELNRLARAVADAAVSWTDAIATSLTACGSFSIENAAQDRACTAEAVFDSMVSAYRAAKGATRE